MNNGKTEKKGHVPIMRWSRIYGRWVDDGWYSVLCNQVKGRRSSQSRIFVWTQAEVTCGNCKRQLETLHEVQGVPEGFGMGDRPLGSGGPFNVWT